MNLTLEESALLRALVNQYLVDLLRSMRRPDVTTAGLAAYRKDIEVAERLAVKLNGREEIAA